MPPAETILYVDDERGNRVVFQHTFAQAFQIKTCESAAAALEILANEPIAVIVADQRMPVMAGNELLQRVKDLHPEIVRIVITAYSEIDPILEAVNNGLVARYVIKPWDRDELEKILSWSVEVHRLGQQSSELQLRLLNTERFVTLGSMAAFVFHDLKQPVSHLQINASRLQAIAEYAQLVEQLRLEAKHLLAPREHKKVQELTEELPELAEDIEHGCSLILALTETISGLIRQQREKPEPPERAVDPVPVIESAIRMCAAAVKLGGKLLYQGPDALPKVRIAAIELTQVLMNLFLNAAQAFTEANKRNGRIVVTAEDSGDRVEFKVADDGPGMSEEVKQKVGTMFFTTRKEGTGLGIVQCQRLISKASGDLRIESTASAGTTVTFHLPKV